ncbi:MAG: hypothetical protein MRERC_5c076 [Mycoplasmataceae bacterium RC_NB112A]|nr:MAG: hypothetical protein MRERC_5c076 [Mycoplasmataceae bacterium RC_NB112A]
MHHKNFERKCEVIFFFSGLPRINHLRGESLLISQW